MATFFVEKYFLNRFAIAFLIAPILQACVTPFEAINNQDEAFDEAIFLEMKGFDPRVEAKSLISEKRFVEAEEYLDYFASVNDTYKDNIEINELLKQVKDNRSSYKYKLKTLYESVVTGKSDEGYGETAAMISDFVLVGDLRDLYDETTKRLTGQELDKLTIALAGLGVIGTSAPYLKPGLSFLKLANKSGKLPSWLIDEIKLATRSEDGIRNLVSKMQLIHSQYQKIGTRNTLVALSNSKNTKQFNEYAELLQLLGNQSATLIKISGQDGLQVLNKFKHNPRLLREVSIYGKSGIKALDQVSSAKLTRFLDIQNEGRRRMTNLELDMIKNGKIAVINKHEVVQKDHQFDPCHKVSTGETNLYRMQQGLAPIGFDDQPINLHHMKQQKDGLLVETTSTEHKKHHELLHRYTNTSEIDRDSFNEFRKTYWKVRFAGLPKKVCNISYRF